MTAEQQSANNRLGLIFVSIAVFFWGILPIALKLSGGFITPVTLTWFRFLMALVVTLLIQWKVGALRQFVGLPRAIWLKLTLAGVLLMCNYVSFVYSLSYLAPGTAQLNFQTAPFFLAFGGVLFFKERFNAFQLSCFATLALGMLMFFHPQLDMDQARDEQVHLLITSLIHIELRMKKHQHAQCECGKTAELKGIKSFFKKQHPTKS